MLLVQIGSIKKATLYFEKASALMATDPAVARDGAIQTQLLLTQGLLLFTTEQVRVRACGDACCYTVANGWRCCWW
jgi:hypothetical protein